MEDVETASGSAGVQSTVDGGAPINSKTQEADDHPTAKVWSVYMSEATPHDKALVESWSKDMDGILIFAGLFSASVTTFLVASYPGLMPDPNQPSISLQQQILIRLGGNVPQSQISALDSFSPSSSTNARARNYLQAVHRRPAPHVQARIRTYLYQGFEKYHMSAVVEGIPTLLHASVFLFFAGLIDFLFALNRTIAFMTLTVVAAFGGLYILISVLPVLDRQSPFLTPLSEPCWAFCQFLGLLRYRCCGRWKRLCGSMWEGREMVASAIQPGSVGRNAAALSWTLKTLTEDRELLPFVEGIPAFCTSRDDSNVDVMRQIITDKDTQLLQRSVALLGPYEDTGSLVSSHTRMKTVACLNAISSLCQIYSGDSWELLHTYEPTLRQMIMPRTRAQDSQIARAAIIAADSVAQHIQRCITLSAQHGTRDAYKSQVLRVLKALNGPIIAGEYGWGLSMLLAWDSLTPLCRLVPDLATSTEISVHTYGLGPEPESVIPAFRDEVLWFFDHEMGRMLQSVGDADLCANDRHRQHTLLLLETCFYTSSITLSGARTIPKAYQGTADGSKMGVLRTALARVKDLTAFAKRAHPNIVTRYTICAAVYRSACLQHHLANLRSSFGSLYASDIVSNFACLPNPRSMQIGTKPAALLGNSDTFRSDLTWVDFDGEINRLYEELPPDEQEILLAFPGIDGQKALYLFQNYIRLLVILIEHYPHPAQCDSGSLNLACRAVKSMASYLNARFSCRKDQMRLLKSCRMAISNMEISWRQFFGEDPSSYARDEQAFGFVHQIAAVLVTISDPILMVEARYLIQSWNRTARQHQLGSIPELTGLTPLEPLEYSTSVKFEETVELTQPTATSQIANIADTILGTQIIPIGRSMQWEPGVDVESPVSTVAALEEERRPEDQLSSEEDGSWASGH
ncbi:hypothetical protein HWV62_30753 [Athelia sp. TMB]|nr:hypothetical protein HWV62_30753 [Athelia sp. TMB]